MTARPRLILGLVVALASLACGSSGVSASEEQDLAALGDLLKGLIVKQVFVGTVVVSDAVSGTSSTQDTIETSNSSTTLNHNVVFTVTPGSVVANITYEEKTRVESRLAYQAHTVVGTKTTETIASGTTNDPKTVSVNVDLRSDGTYQINFGTGGVQGLYTMKETGNTICNAIEGSTCRPSSTSNSDSGKPPNQGGIGGSVDGRIDKKDPNVLTGSMSEPLTRNDGSTGRRTVTWNLARRTP